MARGPSPSPNARKPGPAARAGQPQGRASWVAAALAVLAEEGIDQVRIERLARQLGITKGSFYHHFRDRADLHAAMLDLWRQRMVTEIIADLDRIENPRERFLHLLQVPGHDRRANLDLELAVRLWARRDGGVRAVLCEVDALRLAYVADVIAQCGLSPQAAQARALLAYALLRTGDAPRDAAQLAECARLLTAG